MNYYWKPWNMTQGSAYFKDPHAELTLRLSCAIFYPVPQLKQLRSHIMVNETVERGVQCRSEMDLERSKR